MHITPENFSSCVAAIRTFVEASYRGESQSISVRRMSTRSGKKTPKNKQGSIRKARTEPRHGGGYVMTLRGVIFLNMFY